MTRDLFAERLIEFDRDMVRQKKVLLVLDNRAAHHVQPSLTAVTVLLLPPDATSRIQPLDLGIIHSFKACYRRRLVQRLLITIDTPAANAEMAGPSTTWDDLVSADDDTEFAEPFTDEGIVNEVRTCDAEDSDESDADDDLEAPPAAVGTPAAIEYIAALKQLVCTRGLGNEHLGAINKLETAVIGSAFAAQVRITDYLCK